ncbi:hypothetical protein QQ045_027886 [Rhodiola kirilowii]
MYAAVNLNGPVMSADDNEQTMIKGLESGAVYVMHKPVRPEELENVWQYAIPKRNQESHNDQPAVIYQDTNALGSHSSSSDQNEGPAHIAQIISQVPTPTEENTNSTVAVPDQNYEASKPKRKSKNSSEGYHKYLGATLARKQKLAWSTGLHNKFLHALRVIGLDRAVPKKILEVMNVHGLTRENVASHLQKYRMFVRRLSEVTKRPDGTCINRKSKFALSNFLPHYNFQLAHLENTDENILRKRLQAIRDPLHMNPSWKNFGPTHSNNSGFASERSEFSDKQMPLMIRDDRLMGVGGMRSTNQLTLGSSSNEIMHQAASISNDMTENATENTGIVMDNNSVNCQMVTVQHPELQTGGVVNDISPQGTIGTQFSRIVSQEATFGNANIQYNMNNAPSQPLELQNVNDAGNGYMYEMINNLDLSAFQSEFPIEQFEGGDQTINSLQFGEGSSNMIQTGNGDVQYCGGDFQPWFDQEPNQIQPENQNTNMHIADELIAMYQGLQDDVVESSYIGSSKSNNAS